MQERSRELQVLAARLAAQQEAVAASAVVAERSRIAREVHDSVAHSVSVMVLQMGGLRRLLPDKPEAQEVLLGLERLGREAVDEMRRVVGILREGAGGDACRPAPSPRCPGWTPSSTSCAPAGCRSSCGDREPVELPQLVDVSAVRVVQEALSNVRPARRWRRHRRRAGLRARPGHRHGHRRRPAPAAAGRPAAETAPGGHGQLHMRERVAVAGGALEVGPRPRRRLPGAGRAFPVPARRARR